MNMQFYTVLLQFYRSSIAVLLQFYRSSITTLLQFYTVLYVSNVHLRYFYVDESALFFQSEG